MESGSDSRNDLLASRQGDRSGVGHDRSPLPWGCAGPVTLRRAGGAIGVADILRRGALNARDGAAIVRIDVFDHMGDLPLRRSPSIQLLLKAHVRSWLLGRCRGGSTFAVIVGVRRRMQLPV